MVITPDTDIILLKCPLTLDNKNQLTFQNTSKQYQYFHSLPTLYLNTCTYQRKDNVIRYPRKI